MGTYSKKALTLFLAGALAVSWAVPSGAKKKPKPVVMGTDSDADWGSNVDAQLSPIGQQLGMELTEASITPVDKENLDFVISVSALPGSGGIPEFVRYVWTLTVDGDLVQLDGKFTNYTRGTCDPTAGTCPPPRDPGEAPFMVRANCTDNGGAAVTCEELGIVNGEFDAEAGTISVTVPMELIGAKPGSKITHGVQPGSNFAGIWAIPSAWASQGNMPYDELVLTNTYVVSRR